MTRKKNNSPSSGPNGKKSETRSTLVFPTKKTVSSPSTEAAEDRSKTGLTSETKKKASAPASAHSSQLRQPLPVPKQLAKVDRVAEALKRLKVKPQQLETLPKITETYKNAEGGLKAVLNAMRSVGNDDAIAAFLKKYDAVPEGDRQRVPWEAVALAAKIDVRTLSGAIMNAIAVNSGNISRILALTGHPKLMKARIKWGQLPGGDKDRMAVDMMVGALPTPKGTTITVNPIFGAGDGKQKDDTEDGEVFDAEGDLDDLFPSPTAMQEKLVPVRALRDEN